MHWKDNDIKRNNHLDILEKKSTMKKTIENKRQSNRETSFKHLKTVDYRKPMKSSKILVACIKIIKTDFKNTDRHKEK